MRKKIHKGKLLRNIILLLLLVGVVGVYFSNRYIKTKGFDNLIDFVSTYRENKSLVEHADTKTMQILINDRDFKFIEQKRQEALDRGIQINIGDNYVDCKVLLDKDTIEGEMRLKGHMTDHLEGEKWSFRVKTEEEVLGMYRFSLQNPATRNYAYEWVYHQLLANENVIHLKYEFIDFKLNDNDLGIYAVEEHFGQHVLEDNSRPKGAILRWNPELYWEWRIDEFEGTYLDEAYSSYSSSFAQPYDQGVVKRDDELVATYVKGARLLEAFRRGDKTTAEVFDIEKMASFHAVIDLVGGYHSLDWSDVKLFYNTESNKIEPVGYESFSVRETHKIAGQRTPEDYEDIGFNYHDQLFNDPVFFEAYIKALNRICSAEYVSNFENSITDELNKKRGTLAAEFAYIKFSFKPYYDNVERIRHNIELPKPFHAFLEDKNDSLVKISVTPVSDYPIEILGLTIKGKDPIKPTAPFVLPAKARDTYATYFELSFETTKKVKDAFIQAKIPGGSTIFEVSVSELPSYRFQLEEDQLQENEIEDTVLVWLNDSTACIKGDLISGRIVIPENKSLLISNKKKLTFTNSAHVVVKGDITLQGTSDIPLEISGGSINNASIDLQGGRFIARNTSFVSINKTFIRSTDAQINLQSCTFANLEAEFINATKSKVVALNCLSGSLYSLGVFDRCEVKLKSFTGNKGEVFLTAYGSDVEIRTSSFEGYKQLTDLNYSSNLSTWSSSFKNIGLIGTLNNHSSFDCYLGDIQATKKGFEVDLETNLAGESSYLLYRTNSIIENIEERKG